MSQPQQSPAKGASSSASQVPALQIERIMGMSQSGCNGSSPVIDGATASSGSMAINPTNGDIAYVAGAFIVIYGVKSSKQEKFLKQDRCRPFQCLTYSKNGDYFAACEASPK